MKRKIEIFSADCPACKDTIALVNQMACPSCDVQILNMNQEDVANRAKAYGIQRVPSIVIDGKLADCCTAQGPDETMLRAVGIGG
jgi:glutaredoxin 3